MRQKLLRFEAALMLVVCIALGLGVEVAYASGFQSEVREGVAVVALYMEDQQGNSALYSWGSCFFVGEEGENPEYLVTNHHVVAEYLEYGGGEFVEVAFTDGSTGVVRLTVRVYFNSSEYVEAYVVDYNEKKDLAVLRLASSTDKRSPLPLCSPTEDMVGSPVYCVGYPGLSENIIISASSSWSETDASVTTGTISRFVTSSGTGVKRIQTDAVIQQGNSGGPMVNENGSVVGVNSLYIMNETETNYYAVSIDEVIPMLNNNNVPYTMEGKGGGGSQNKTLIIGIVAVLAVVVVVVLIVVVLSSKKKKASAQPQPEPQPMTQAGPQPMPQPQPVKRGMLRSMSVQHNGVTYPVGESAILVGRDASNCTVVYREGTPGVSGRHCTVSYQPGTEEFLVTDLRSTYGTFLMNGQRLEPNVPYHLRAGESFYVGDQANVLRVEVG